MQFRSIGKDVTIYPQAKIICPEEISIGNSVIIDDFAFLYGKGGITIGDFVHLASFCLITGDGGLVLEDFVSISGGVYFYTSNDDYSGMSLTNPTVPKKYKNAVGRRIHVGKHTIIGAQTIILPGVKIGEGVAIGSNSLVKDDCVPWMIYAGTPAKPIKARIRNKIPELEKRLRREAYDKDGNYIPKDLR